ncbi:glutamate--cysteine ligase [Streptomyces fuscichromogenes]|uniref:carboxylate-amine ligase n=1 Tax=Streptomyces fuscichromogenes TaxID=1324013 RepID=UPI003825A09C
MITLGVEEEYLLIDAVTGRLAPQGDKVRAVASLKPFVADQELHSELSQAQVEAVTPVCATLEEVGGHLLRLRHAVTAAAESLGCRVLASGTPLSRTQAVPVTDCPRYRAMQRQAPQLVAEQLVNGMHIHAAVPDRSTGVQVLNRIRPWLPVLTAMSANSPLWEGEDTGFASWRTLVYDRWPVSGVPPYFVDEADYDRRVRHLVDSGVITDAGQLYWQARLSERYPTIEIRCFDVQQRSDEAVMFAGLVRALIRRAMSEAAEGAPERQPDPELLEATMWQAARHGLCDDLIDLDGERRRAGDVVCRLLRHVSRALEDAGDAREVRALVHRLLRLGTGADRQRQELARGGVAGVTDMITDMSTAP